MTTTCSFLVFGLSLALYYFTLAPTATLVDSGELILAAHSLGVAHPPGFPLYVLLAHIATLVPLGNIAERVNFFSALFAALTASVTCLAAFELCCTMELGSRCRAKPFPKSKLNILLFGNGICCLLASAYALAVYTIYKNPFCKWYK
ncbi:MAG: DUF2723 domain-containing protein, partial [Deltaproteobacteria bacterium]|nr:DUF2723 domain-containing protein [Deltaproteobacteria bacterium]